MMTIETKRLTIRNLTLDDAPFILELLNTPDWITFIGDRGITSIEDAKDYLLAGPIFSNATMGYGFQLVELTKGKTPIGLCGFVKRDSLQHPDLGFAYHHNYFGLGYGFEAALACLQHARDQLNICTVQAITNVDNSKSIKLLSKLGFKPSGTVTLPNETESLLLFSINTSQILG